MSKALRPGKTKYIFVAGGVMSGIGKGITASSIGNIMQARGFSVTAMKIDPYVNVDAGTMNPTEHGEVFVLSDGMECDQDMGNYERFLNKDLPRINYMTTGSVYQAVIEKERNLGYNGKCVSVVPEIPLAVIEKIERASQEAKADIVVIEIGGTVGEYENILFLEAYRILKIKYPGDTVFIMASFLPLQNGGELKTKPTQHAVRAAGSVGIQPDAIVARAKVPVDVKRKEKLAFMCNMSVEQIISAPDVESIYEVPLNFERDGFGSLLTKKLGISGRKPDLTAWKEFVNKGQTAHKKVKVGIVGKYFSTGDFILSDAYISVIEAIKQAAYTKGLSPEIVWLSAGDFEANPERLNELKELDGVIVPGGFGTRSIEGKIAVIEYCRKKKIPYLGLCYGMQLMVVEFARNVAKMKGAHTTEVDKKTAFPVIDILPEQIENLKKENYGGTMRLGDYTTFLKPKTVAAKHYQAEKTIERHRHRYEVNPEYIEVLEKAGLVFSGHSQDGRLMEVAELPESEHPFFIATQSHPELTARPLRPHPLFLGLITAAAKKAGH